VTDSNGELQKESNAKVVKWEDGSMHLILGNEMLDLTLQDLGSEHLFLYVKQRKFLQCQAQLKSKMNIRPTSLNSRLHQKLTLNMAEKSQKNIKVKLVATTVDPEVEKAQREKEEEDRIRYHMKMEAEQRNKAQKYGLDARYLEGDDNDISSYSSGRGGRNEYRTDDFVVDEDEEDGDFDQEEEEIEKRHKKNKHKRKKEERDEEEDAQRLLNAKRSPSPEPAPPKHRKVHKEHKPKSKKETPKKKAEEEEEPEIETERVSPEKEYVPEQIISNEQIPVDDMDMEGEERTIMKRPKGRRTVIDDDEE